jgi:hypothetical protein
VSRRRYTPGQIVWAHVPDRNGVAKPDPRPILVTITHPTDRKAPLMGHAISTDPKNDPEDPAIEMPWDAQTGSTTGLYKWCRVVLLWPVLVEQKAIAQTTGSVSPQFLEMTLAKIQEARLWQLQRRKR